MALEDQWSNPVGWWKISANILFTAIGWTLPLDQFWSILISPRPLVLLFLWNLWIVAIECQFLQAGNKPRLQIYTSVSLLVTLMWIQSIGLVFKPAARCGVVIFTFTNLCCLYTSTAPFPAPITSILHHQWCVKLQIGTASSRNSLYIFFRWRDKQLHIIKQLLSADKVG